MKNLEGIKQLNNIDEFNQWKDCGRFKGDVIETPKQFPCFAYKIPRYWNTHESTTHYIYEENLIEMLNEFPKDT